MKRYIIALLLGLVLSETHAAPPPLTAFGHGNITMNGVPAQGQRPLLIILADTAPIDDTPNDDSFAHPPSYYHDRTRNFFSFPSVNGFLLENSLGDFFLSNAGIVDMIDRPGHDGMEYTQAERDNWKTDTAQSRDARVYGDTINAAARAGYDFAQHDANNNNVIEQQELMVLIVENISNADNGAARGANPGGLQAKGAPPVPPFIIQGTNKEFRSQVCAVTHRVSFATLAHELIHLIGMKDLYSNGKYDSSNTRQTLAGPTIITAPDNLESFHLDPWHKLQFGWCEPQVMDMQNGGVVNLQANQGNSANKHLILYDSAKVIPGEPFVREFFILEYRTRSSGVFAGYDGGTNDDGLVIWHIHHNANGLPALVPTPYIRGDANVDDPANPDTIGFQLGMMGGVFTLAPPTFVVGGGLFGPPALGGAWESGSTTPKLPWTIFPGPNLQEYNGYAGTPSLSHVFVRPFSPNATQITVEVFTEADTWADFFYPGIFPLFPENGTFDHPYNTFLEGINEVGYGGHLRIKSSGSRETVTSLSKPMTITAEGGPVTIGVP